MSRLKTRGHIALLSVLALTYPAMAAAPSIGIASARGSIRVDGTLVRGNATLFEGSVIETARATTALRLNQGVVVKLAVDSRGQLFRDRLVLEKGASELTGAYRLEAATLRIDPDGPDARGVVAVTGDRKIEVTALAGAFRVKNGDGMLLANVHPGAALAFHAQVSGATAPTTITGKLTKEGGNYFVTVASTGVKYQVTGAGITDSKVGKTVTVTGTPDPNGNPAGKAAGVIAVSSATVAAHAAGAGGAATGMAVGTKLIIAGVAVAAGTGVGVGVYEAQKEDTPASR